jgi:hypothetical protein
MRVMETVGLEGLGQRRNVQTEAGPFVLNLCPVPGPIAIPQPRSPQLVRYAFFCSRGLEGDREQCWLHMGYFPTRAEACKWLDVLRRVYPLAFLSAARSTFEYEHAVVPQFAATRRRG